MGVEWLADHLPSSKLASLPLTATTQKKKSDKKNEKEKDFHVLSFLFWLSPWILSVNSSGTLCSLNFLQQVASLSPSNKQTHTESDTQLISDVCVSALSC